MARSTGARKTSSRAGAKKSLKRTGTRKRPKSTSKDDKKLLKAGEADFPTRFGNFRIYAFEDGKGGEHLALVMPPDELESVPVRIHSKCVTGDTFSSLRCDCRSQLEAALDYIRNEGRGILLYLDQEGRGIGLANKIKAYSLQDEGMDTVEANEHLGFDADGRNYLVAAEILKQFGVTSVELLTNNPDKIKGLEEHGITVSKRVPLIVGANEHNADYLETKKKKLKHLFE